MPMYEFKRPNGEVVTLFMSVAEYERRTTGRGKIEIDGQTCQQTYGGVRVPHPGNWPLESKALGVGVDEIEEAKADDARHGLKHDYNPETGDAIFSSVGQKRAALKKHHWRDNDAYC